MSAVARDYAFMVTQGKEKKEVPTISKERIEQAKKNVASLMAKKNGTKA
jgi:hypothetical protein